jgi:thiamine biosynthesis protein ThiS
VADVLNHLNIARERVAVVVNEQVVRRANLESTPLNEGDVIEIITMVGGG